MSSRLQVSWTSSYLVRLPTERLRQLAGRASSQGPVVNHLRCVSQPIGGQRPVIAHQQTSGSTQVRPFFGLLCLTNGSHPIFVSIHHRHRIWLTKEHNILSQAVVNSACREPQGPEAELP